MSRLGESAFKVAGAALLLPLLLWPAIYNGQPLFSSDTSAYIRGFDAALVWISGHMSAWTTWASEAAGQAGNPDALSHQSPQFIIAGRSISYGALLYIGDVLGGLWATVIFQAAAVLLAISLTLQHFNLLTWPRLVLTTCVLGLASSVPFFASFLLPDIFASLSILAAANLLTHATRLTRKQYVFWTAVMMASVVFHPTHLAVLLILLILGVIVRLSSARIEWVGIGALALATCVGIASEISFANAIEKVLGTEVVRPPVITARIIVDGPGASYLRNKCPEANFAVCQFVDRLEVANSDAFLWDTSPLSGIYAPSKSSMRRALGNEQFQLVAAVFSYDPGGLIAAFLRNTAQQFGMIGLSDLVSTAQDAFARLPRAYADRMEKSAVWRDALPTRTFSALDTMGCLIAAGYLGYAFLTSLRTISTAQVRFCCVILLGLIANAFICGSLSGPHERYQARLTWLVPLVGLVAFYERRSARQVSMPALRVLYRSTPSA